MARRRKSGGEKKEKRTKPTKVALLAREHAGKVTGAYKIMEELIAERHAHLADAKIVVAWMYGKKPDADGRVYFGDARRASDLDRELHNYDWVILLPHELWNDGGFKEEQMYALMDHHLQKCCVTNDSDGEPKVDDRGRKVYRKRKPIGVFSENVARFGLWHEDLRQLGLQIHDANDRPLLKGIDEARESRDAGTAAGAARDQWPGGKQPGRVRITRHIPGIATDDWKLFKDVEVNVHQIVNDAPVVLGGNKLTYHLRPGDWECVRWDDVPAAEAADAEAEEECHEEGAVAGKLEAVA